MGRFVQKEQLKTRRIKTDQFIGILPLKYRHT